MSLHKFGPRTAFATGLLAMMLASSAWSQQLIANGGFEADTKVIQSPDAFTAWSAAEDGIIGGVAINQGNSAPASGTATVGAASGSNYAVLDLAAPSRMALLQSFSIGASPVPSATLSFQWFANYLGSESAFINGPQALDYAGSAEVLSFRVDILKAGAATFSTDAADLAFSALLSAPLSAGPSAYRSFSQEVSGLLTGATYMLRFSAAANTGLLTVGVDNVAFAVAAVPEPSGFVLMLAGLALIGLTVARRCR